MKTFCMIISFLIATACFGKTDITGKWKVIEPLLYKNLPVMQEENYVHFVFAKDNTFLNIFENTSQSGTYIIKNKIIELTYSDRKDVFEIYYSTSTELILKRKKDGFIMRLVR